MSPVIATDLYQLGYQPLCVCACVHAWFDRARQCAAGVNAKLHTVQLTATKANKKKALSVP